MAMSAVKRGRPAGRVRPTSGFVVDAAAAKAASIRSCPECGSYRCKCQGMRRKKDGSAVRRWNCKCCGHKWTQQYPDDTPLVDARLLIVEIATERECTSCRKVKRLEDFGLFKDKPRHVCKPCTNEEWSRRSLAGTLAQLGMTVDDYSEEIKSQNGLCKICGTPGNGKGRRYRPLCIDHCHLTGKFRGLLCDRCNLGIGNFDDDPARLIAAANYILENKGNS